MASSKKGFQHHRLLSVKALLLNLKSMALRKSEHTHDNQKDVLGSMQARKQAHLKSAKSSADPQTEPNSTSDLQVRTWYTEQLNEDLRRQIHDVRIAEQEVSEQRAGVEQSAREKQSLEKLKEQQDYVASVEAGRVEQKEIDEISGRRRAGSRRAV